ncbi:endo-1,4-beta-xylanase [Teredinibacter franksiae]|uniref:endo-1,4-beta-xylanase n=1 Tax=Teredinibacter franksiae TaxID=2761453 RepID=UPI001629A7DA|nr:endo-1,4-beta-xylanase [Teredinibacter franksiae]
MTLTRRQFLIHAAAATTSFASLKAIAWGKAASEFGLKDQFKDDFYIGTALSGRKIREAEPRYMSRIGREFNALTMENSMKWEAVRPQEGVWRWENVDRFVALGEKLNAYRVGHVLVWHAQTPEWVFSKPNGDLRSRKDLAGLMEAHIQTYVDRYKGRIHAWDVVNEAIDGGKAWRKSHWYNILGEGYIDRAFNCAHDADPKAHLIYNDYNMDQPHKREQLLSYIRRAKKRGVPIHGVGLQSHVGLSFPNIDQFEQSIEAFAAEGMRIHITELDMDVLPVAWEHVGAEISTRFEYSKELNPYPNGLPMDVEQLMVERYVQFFKLFLKHRDKIDRVTFWGVGDGESWKNDFPVIGRTNYPLLFDRDYKKKKCYHAIAALGHTKPQ